MPSRSSLARLLQVACLSQMAFACGWLAWRWEASPMQAIVGAALILGVAPLVLGIEFVFVWHVARSDPAPRPSPRQLLRAWLSETRHLFQTFYWRQPCRWRAVPDHLHPSCAGTTGVVLVHGFMCNRGFWNAWMRHLLSHGRAFVAVNLEPVYASVDDYAGAIDDAVVRVTACTGMPPLIVCHSMGGLAARAWWRHCAGQRAVAAMVTIGTPHGGTWLARFSSRPNGRQMRLVSEWLHTLSQHESHQQLPPITCWYSNCDNVVFPPSTATLAGADNRFIPGEAHVALAFHPEVRQACMQLLERS